MTTIPKQVANTLARRTKCQSAVCASKNKEFAVAKITYIDRDTHLCEDCAFTAQKLYKVTYYDDDT